VMGRVELPQQREGLTFGRRIRNVCEIMEGDRFVNVSEWDPVSDSYNTDLEKSELLEAAGYRQGLTKEEIIQEINRREEIITFLFKSNLSSQGDVSRTLVNYGQFRKRQKYAPLMPPKQRVLKVY